MATVNTDGSLTLVLGGNGKTGRRVADRLRAHVRRTAAPGVWEG